MAKKAPWRMVRMDQRFRADQVEAIDGLIEKLHSEGLRREEVNRSNLCRLAFDLGLAVLEDLIIPELLEELQREHNRKYDVLTVPE